MKKTRILTLFIVLIIQVQLLTAQAVINPPTKQWEYAEFFYTFLTAPASGSNPNNNEDWLYDVLETKDGNFISVGYAEYDNALLGMTDHPSQPIIIKNDKFGNSIWKREITVCDRHSGTGIIGPNSRDLGGKLNQVIEVNDSRGHFYVAVGSKTYYDNNYTNSTKIRSKPIVVIIDDDGNILNNTTYNGVTYHDFFYKLF
jgi:hypothetical protein